MSTRRVWGDANLIVRLVTNDPPAMAERAERFLERAEQGEFSICLHPMIVAECAWVLSSFYKVAKVDVAQALEKVLSNAGWLVLEEDAVLEALRVMALKNVDYVDAFLAACAKASGEAVASFDRDHKKLGVALEKIE